MDKIIIRNATYAVHIGVSEEERAQSQELLIDLELFCDITKAVATDDITDTINYSHVCKLVARLLERKHYCLIETVAELIAQNILQTFNFSRVEVCIKKTHALRNAKYAAMSIIRKK